MAQYRYKARGQRGDAILGTLEAASTDAVATQLLATGLIPIEIDAVQAAAAGRHLDVSALFPVRVRSTDIIQFSRQMYSLTKAGVPILSALGGLGKTTKNPLLAQAIKAVSESLESGRDLATALSAHPDLFSPFYISMIRIGETTGQLDAIFLQLAVSLERDKRTRDQIKAAMRYPTFVMVAITAAMAVINLWVIPVFGKVFAKYGAVLPLPTRILLATSNFAVAYWPYILALGIVAAVGVRHYVGTDAGHYRWDKAKLRLPIVGPLVYRATLARFARLFSMATRAGVPLITALTVVARALDNRFVEERILTMQTGIERGDSIGRTAAATGMFDALVLQMIAVGEESGTVDTLLHEVAEYYDAEVQYDIDRLSASIEPILTVIIAGMVLILALGVFLPMWNLASVAFHR